MQINLEFRALNSMLWDTDGVVCLSSQGKGRKAEKLNPFTGLRQDGNPLIPPPIFKEIKSREQSIKNDFIYHFYLICQRNGFSNYD